MTSIIGRKYVKILEVNLDSTQKEEVLRKISYFWQIKHKFSLFTPNPEILVEANRDQNYRRILNQADINIPDGIGLKFASRFLYGKALDIIPGRKLFLEIIKLAKDNNRKVFFLGGKGLKQVLAGPKLEQNGEPVDLKERRVETEIINKINISRPDILFVGFGAPKQEKWIARNLPQLNVGGVMAVGGTFDYVFGKAKLPPDWVEASGFEWLWRLLHEPRRVFRILTAVFIFPWKIFWNKFH